jgi:hypothetical protein
MGWNGSQRLVSFVACVLLASVFLVAINSPMAAAAESKLGLVEQVNQLGQECQSVDNLSVEQLQEVISRCDALSETVMLSEHLQRKLLIIRLKKSRNLCLYLLQLQQRE